MVKSERHAKREFSLQEALRAHMRGEIDDDELDRIRDKYSVDYIAGARALARAHSFSKEDSNNTWVSAFLRKIGARDSVDASG